MGKPTHGIKLSVLAVAFVLLFFSLPTASFASRSAATGPLLTVKHCTDCWSGYSDFASGGVTASYISVRVPTAHCTAGTIQVMVIAAAIDGGSSSDFAMAGVAIECTSSGLVYAGFYCDLAVPTCGFSTWSPAPGDIVKAEVIVTSGMFYFGVKDLTSSKTFTKTNTDTGSAFDVGSCITDMVNTSTGFPQLYTATGGGYGQPKFSIIGIGEDNTKVANTCYTTIGGVSKAIGSHTGVTLVKWIAYSTASAPLTTVTALMAAPPGALSSFRITFLANGP